MRVPIDTIHERPRLFEAALDWAHAVMSLVLLPVLAGVVIAPIGWWWGLAAFAAVAVWGVWAVRRTFAAEAPR